MMHCLVLFRCYKQQLKVRGYTTHQWRNQDFSMVGGWAQSSGQFLQFFNKNNAFYAYFVQNTCFKAIIHQSKAFKISLNVINWINEVQVL